MESPLLTEQQYLDRLLTKNYQRIAATASGAATSLSAVFYPYQQLSYSISCTVSANNAALQATVDGSNYFTIASVSGTGVVSGSMTAQYTDVRPYVNTYSSGTLNFDFTGKH